MFKIGHFPTGKSQIVCLAPASETVVNGNTVILTDDCDGGQVPLLIVHFNMTSPGLRPLITERGSEGDTIVPDPVTVHNPVPTSGVFADKDVLELHTVWPWPAFDAVGISSTKISTFDCEEGHEPFDMVQVNSFKPVFKPVTPVLGLSGAVMVPEPFVNDHEPLPLRGVFPFNVVVAEQIFCAGPAAGGGAHAPRAHGPCRPRTEHAAGQRRAGPLKLCQSTTTKK